jgi:hypothetical protein
MAAQETGKPDNAGVIGSTIALSGWEDRHHLARLVLVAFLITFTVSRIVVFLIMSRTLPDLYVYIGGTHVHHLNWGIFLLSTIGGYLLFVRPQGRAAEGTAILYGIGLALTFDEFGMWLHLGGGYWQRASFDAVTVVAGLLMLTAFGPSIREFRGKHAITLLILLLLGAGFFVLLIRTVNKYAGKVQPRIENREPKGPAGVSREAPPGHSDSGRLLIRT